MNQFSQFNLPESIIKALEGLNFTTPTPIQTQAIPLAIAAKDLIATAQTGTGKTAAFSIPTLMNLLKKPNSNALVLVPTRELAIQIETFWKQLTKFNPEMRFACLIGGTSYGPQFRALAKKPRFIIATPGRLVDHIRQKTLKLNFVETLVLDEADRMLDMGFAPQLNEVLKFLPNQRQTFMFSATWDEKLNQLSKKFLKNPERIAVGVTSRAADTIEQKIVQTTAQKKNDTLLDEINARQGSILIFARTKIRTDRVAKFLDSYGLNVAKIHGDRTQKQRNTALDLFKSGRTRVMVATDVASRGIDVKNISHVINYDLPQVAEDYVHRIGRTGRAGATGQALSILTPEDRGMWREISFHLKRTGSELPKMDPTAPIMSTAGSINSNTEMSKEHSSGEKQDSHSKRRFNPRPNRGEFSKKRFDRRGPRRNSRFSNQQKEHGQNQSRH